MAAETEVPNLVVNIGSGEGHSLCDVLDIMRDTIDVDFEVQYQPGRPFDVPKIVLDVSRARQLLDWVPTITMESGILRTWKWVHNHVPVPA
jgi:UDP-glucose 4-epimerase